MFIDEKILIDLIELSKKQERTYFELIRESIIKLLNQYNEKS